MKVLAKDLKAWWSLPDWPDGQYIDDDAYKVNGEEIDASTFDVTKLADTDRVEILCGSIVNGSTGADLGRAVSKWLKSRDSVTLLVGCHKDKEPEVRAALKSLGCELHK